MKKFLTGAYFLTCTVCSSMHEEAPSLHLTSHSLQSVSTQSFSSCENVSIVWGFYEKDLKTLGKFSKTRVLDLHAAMDIKHIDKIPPMDSVERLNLCGLPISDKDVEHLTGVFKKLKELDISSTGILGTGLPKLKDLGSLETLNVSSTLISNKEYIVDLLNSLPNLTIYLYDTLIPKSGFMDNPRVIFEKHDFK